MSNLIGSNHEILDVLGQGGMGTVYAAKNLQTGQRVAIKSLHVRGAIDPDDPDLLRFSQEARIASALASPHINSAFGIEIDPETHTPILIMDLLDGEDVDALVRRVGPLRVDTALRIAAQVCLGLKAAHDADVVHRDIKPGNLFLARSDEGGVIVKILDFGIAKIRRLPPDASQQQGGLTAPQVSMTATGQILGSPLYMAPEQVDTTKTIDARTDVFSLGKTLYAMLTGAPPQQPTKSLVKMLQRILTEPPPSVRETAPWVPVNVAEIVYRATRLAPEDRYASVEEFRQAIVACLSGDTNLRDDMLVAADQTDVPVEPPATERAPAAVDDAPTEPKETKETTTPIEIKKSLDTPANEPGKNRNLLVFLVVGAIIAIGVAAALSR